MNQHAAMVLTRELEKARARLQETRLLVDAIQLRLDKAIAQRQVERELVEALQAELAPIP